MIKWGKTLEEFTTKILEICDKFNEAVSDSTERKTIEVPVKDIEITFHIKDIDMAGQSIVTSVKLLLRGYAAYSPSYDAIRKVNGIDRFHSTYEELNTIGYIFVDGRIVRRDEIIKFTYTPIDTMFKLIVPKYYVLKLNEKEITETEEEKTTKEPKY